MSDVRLLEWEMSVGPGADPCEDGTVGSKLFTFFGTVERARSMHFLCRTVANVAVLLTEIRLWNAEFPSRRDAASGTEVCT